MEIHQLITITNHGGILSGDDELKRVIMKEECSSNEPDVVMNEGTHLGRERNDGDLK